MNFMRVLVCLKPDSILEKLESYYTVAVWVFRKRVNMFMEM